MHDGVGGPACVVVPMLSDLFQEHQFAVFDDIGVLQERRGKPCPPEEVGWNSDSCCDVVIF